VCKRKGTREKGKASARATERMFFKSLFVGTPCERERERERERGRQREREKKREQ